MDDFELSFFDKQRQMELDDIICKILFLHTPMLYSNTNGLNGVASSLYIKYLGKEFLITVGHIFPENEIINIYIALVNISLSNLSKGMIFLPPNDQNDYHEMDYSIFFIDDDISKQLKVFYTPILIDESIKKTRMNFFQYIVFGFPEKKNRFNPRKNSKIIPSYLCLRLPRTEFNIDTTNKNHNIILDFNKKNAIETKNIKSTITQTIPQLNGMSGCGIWAIPSYPLDFDGYLLAGMLVNSDNCTKVIGFDIYDIIQMLDIVMEEYPKSKTTGIVVSKI